MTNQTSCVCRVLAAEPEAVFDAFVHPDALATWLAPGDMTAVVHNFDGRVGGGYEMSLYYPSAESGYGGKTAEAEDRYTARYTVLDRPYRVVAKITFHTKDAAFAGEMTMDVTLRRQDGGTEVCIAFENIPAGVRPEDNEKGTRSSLQKLALYLEQIQEADLERGAAARRTPRIWYAGEWRRVECLTGRPPNSHAG